MYASHHVNKRIWLEFKIDRIYTRRRSTARSGSLEVHIFGAHEAPARRWVEKHVATVFIVPEDEARLGGTVRLPSEAEWEYAARGLEGRACPWGNTPLPDCDVAIIDPSTVPDTPEGGCGTSSTWPVCSRLNGKTPEGLCDMAGNV